MYWQQQISICSVGLSQVKNLESLAHGSMKKYCSVKNVSQGVGNAVHKTQNFFWEINFYSV